MMKKMIKKKSLRKIRNNYKTFTKCCESMLTFLTFRYIITLWFVVKC